MAAFAGTGVKPECSWMWPPNKPINKEEHKTVSHKEETKSFSVLSELFSLNSCGEGDRSVGPSLRAAGGSKISLQLKGSVLSVMSGWVGDSPIRSLSRHRGCLGKELASCTVSDSQYPFLSCWGPGAVANLWELLLPCDTAWVPVPRVPKSHTLGSLCFLALSL